MQIGEPARDGVVWPEAAAKPSVQQSAGKTPDGDLRGELMKVDSEFSKVSDERGTGEAFGRYAAPDGALFSATGELLRGPEEIRENFADWPAGASLVWWPVAAEAASSGDLGYSVGKAEFRGADEEGKPMVVYTKYLTMWGRQRDGAWRYVVDGGNRRPAAPRP